MVLAAGFVALGALRWASASPRPRWLMPALVGIVVTAVFYRLGVWGLLAGVGVAFALWVVPQPRTPLQRGMSAAEARAVLGVAEGASVADIRAAYRARIATAHPDRGGTADAAARINAARDVLLKKPEPKVG